MKQGTSENEATQAPREQERPQTAWAPAGFLWEQPFKGILQASTINPIPCGDPLRDPNCS